MSSRDELGLWLERLENVRATGKGWEASCPLPGHKHGDRDRSLTIAPGDKVAVVTTCHAFEDHTYEALHTHLGIDRANGQAPRAPWGNRSLAEVNLPMPGEIKRFAGALQANERALALVGEAKGWTPDALSALDIGLMPGGRLSIPIRDLGGKIVNHLRYLPGATNEPKMLAARGHQRAPLYALVPDDDGPMFYDEGETDAISVFTVGFSAVGLPGASVGVNEKWLEPARDRLVVLSMDNDKAGAEAQARWLPALTRVAREVRVVASPVGKDLGDFVLANRHDLDGARAALLALVDQAPGEARQPGDVERVMADARVELVGLIRGGIPERAFVPGAEGLLLVGKRHLWFAAAKIGKSLAALVQAVDIVDHGGRVAILDRENGADEYARRLQDILDARGDGELEADVAERLSYFAYPALRLDHGQAVDYLDVFGNFDLVIFDSSRTFLSASGLKEDVSDDYAQFMAALVEPLSRGGVASLILDNAGHESDGRPRGSSSKGDLNEVLVQVNVIEPFSRSHRGRMGLAIKRSRFAEVTGTFEAPIGGGVYGPFRADDAPLFDRRPDLLDAVVAVLAERSPLGVKKLTTQLQERGHSVGRASAFRKELREWAGAPDGVIVDLGRRGFGLRSGWSPEAGPHLPGFEGGPAPGTPLDPDPSETRMATNDSEGSRPGTPLDTGASGEGGSRRVRSLDRTPPPGRPLPPSEAELIDAATRELDATEITGGEP